MRNNGVVLKSTCVLCCWEPVGLDWAEINVTSYNGSLILSNRTEEAVAATASYIDDRNTYVLARMIDAAKKSQCRPA
jgi:hypothetical protein